MADEPSKSPAPVPVRRPLDRAALERVIQRAGELQAQQADPTEEMSEEQLVALGMEVGLTPQHLKQALAEERTRITLEHDMTKLGQWVGPGTVSTARVVAGKPAEVLATMDRWMQREECLQIKRRFGDRIVWDARRDIVGNIKRGFNVGGRGYHLTKAKEVAATAVVVDEKTTLVRLDADITNIRGARVKGGTAAVATGAMTGGAVIGFGALFAPAVLPFIAIAAIPVLLGATGGYSIVKQYRGSAERVQLSLEQALDALEHAPPPLPGSAAAALINALLPKPRAR
jgi:hypothetical protein